MMVCFYEFFEKPVAADVERDQTRKNSLDHLKIISTMCLCDFFVCVFIKVYLFFCDKCKINWREKGKQTSNYNN